ncbi:ATP-dependent sacrificial sulfur transferase LarE [Planctomicrobium piriforme]|uniref:NAD/GMP synthase domain-containing protein n=1 Tax=Planctomicrobium piriforme TaxID=1576369 RepID=A0A1I3ILI2_9PLAN|nr:ATP-dependent sacrificial sulfur transferase LarE [Planctomicrobium piriforme]SFI48796.1 uncharacterized protein SAMN05421753_109175 [Planctomicrobium piriforme]
MEPQLQQKAERLLQLMSSYGRVAVAFSGGVDSALVAKAAVLACGDRAVAVTGVSPSLASGELELATSVAAELGIRHEVVRTDEFAEPGYQANAGNRCYYCKTELYTELAAVRDRLGVDVICNGANLDDQGDHRPGMRAAQEHHVRSPLIEAGFNKADVRALAKAWNVPVWDKPASPCLSSRIAYGVEVTPERVRRVDAAELFLREALGLRELRVRLEQNELARIEVPLSAIEPLAQPEIRNQVTAEFRRLGFRYVTLDLEGFRSGSLNAALPMVTLEISRPATGAASS